MRMLVDLEELNGLPVERDLIEGEGEDSNEDEKNSDDDDHSDAED